MFSEKEVALKVSAQLEYFIKTNRTKNIDIALFLRTSKQLVSRNRGLLKSGKLPNSKFLIGLCYYYNQNFLQL